MAPQRPTIELRGRSWPVYHETIKAGGFIDRLLECPRCKRLVRERTAQKHDEQHDRPPKAPAPKGWVEPAKPREGQTAFDGFGVQEVAKKERKR